MDQVFIGPLNQWQARNAKVIGEYRVRHTLYRYYILGMENF